MITGHDWRRAIGPRHGYYLRCRRCWITGEEQVETEASVAQAAHHHGELQRHG